MTVASETSSIEYAGDGTTTAFAIPFGFLANSDIQVSQRDALGDSSVLSSGFAITGAGTGTGTCTFTTAPANDVDIIIERIPQLVQPVDWVENERYPAATQERAADRAVYQSQHLRELIRRCLQVPAGDAAINTSNVLPSVSNRKGKVLYFDPSTGAIDVLGIASISGIGSPISQGLLASTLWPRTDAEIAAGVTASNANIPSHDVIGVVLASRYGFSESATGAANYAALVEAHAVSVAAGCSLVLPDGTYDYTPTAAINVAVNFGALRLCTLNCDMDAYSGIVFQIVGSTGVCNIRMSPSGTEQGTAFKQAAVNTEEFTGYQWFRNVHATGFGVNLDIGNIFFNDHENCRYSLGGTGIRCVPDSGGGEGYVTTMTFRNVEVLGNDQNHNFDSTLQSRCIKFITCGFELPQATASTFTRCRELEFDNCYFEGSSSIRAVILADCTASMTNPYLNDTGGIQLGTNTEVIITGLRRTTSTDVLVGGDGTQTVTLIDCQLPSSGNSTSFARYVFINTSINGTFYRYADGPIQSATLTLTGCTTSPTTTMSYDVNNNTVHAHIAAVSATSNDTTCTLTGVPVALRPSATVAFPVILVQDNGANATGFATLNTSGVITLRIGTSDTGFTGSGTKGLANGITLTWRLV